MTSAKFNLQV
jgi:hypothetical protein